MVSHFHTLPFCQAPRQTHSAITVASESWDEDFLFQHSSCSDFHLPSIRHSPRRSSLGTSSSELSLKLDTDDEPTITASDPRRLIAFHRPTSASTHALPDSSSAYNARMRSPTPSLTGLTTGTETDLDTETEEASPSNSLSNRPKIRPEDFDLPEEFRGHHTHDHDQTPRPSAVLVRPASRRFTPSGSSRARRDSTSSRTPRSSAASSSTFEIIDAPPPLSSRANNQQAGQAYDSSLSSTGDDTETDAEYERLERATSFSSTGSVHWAPGFDTNPGGGGKGWALKRRRRKLKKKNRPSGSDSEGALPFPKSPATSQISRRPLLRSRESSAQGSVLSGADTDHPPLAFAEDSGNEAGGVSRPPVPPIPALPFPARPHSTSRTSGSSASPPPLPRFHRRQLSLTAILPRSILSGSSSSIPSTTPPGPSRTRPARLHRHSASLSVISQSNLPSSTIPSSNPPPAPETPPPNGGGGRGGKGFFARARRFSRSAMALAPSPPAASRPSSRSPNHRSDTPTQSNDTPESSSSASAQAEHERAIARSRSHSPIFLRSDPPPAGGSGTGGREGGGIGSGTGGAGRGRASPQRSLGVRPRPQSLALDPAELQKASRPSVSALPTSATYAPLDKVPAKAGGGGGGGDDDGDGKSRRTTTTGNTLARRVSLSDLKIPTRITSAQQKLGEDLRRIKQFRYGVEGQLSTFFTLTKMFRG
jgi:hypothetical protein